MFQIETFTMGCIMLVLMAHIGALCAGLLVGTILVQLAVCVWNEINLELRRDERELAEIYLKLRKPKQALAHIEKAERLQKRFIKL
jgi:hypothetical protein